MSARVHLLMRNTERTPGHTDNRTYTLGQEGADDKTVGPFNDNIKRHVYATTIRFANPSWRRQ
jgi:type IV pilus assembly protein PilW